MVAIQTSGRTGNHIETLEERQMLAAGAPHVVSMVADNRGLAVLTVDTALNSKTVTSKSASIIVGKKKVAAQVALSGKQIYVQAKSLKPNTPYQVRLNGKLIKGTNGAALDGEFNGAARRSGDGTPGGDYVASTKAAKTSVARISTIAGPIDVKFFSTQTPLTVQNFIGYANRGDWDNSFFHRNVPGFVIQGGGYRLGNSGIAGVPAQAPVVNEAHPGQPGNVLGTIAMAKLSGDPNSATNQWFFNLADNRSNLDSQNGGFTVFGKVADKASMTVVKRLASAGVYKGMGTSSPFSDLPVVDLAGLQARIAKDPTSGVMTSDLLMIYRVAIKMDVVAAKA